MDLWCGIWRGSLKYLSSEKSELWFFFPLFFLQISIMRLQVPYINSLRVMWPAQPDRLFINPTSFRIFSVSIRWLLLVRSGGLDMFALICSPFASKTALRCPLRGPGHLFVPFPTFCNYFRTALVCFRSIVGKPTLFSFLGPSPPSFRIMSRMDSSP